jgi:phytoene desaturase
MDTVEGVWFPDGGMHAVPSGLAAAAEKAGATFRYNEPVERIEHGRATPLRVRLASGERIEADAVVANPDLPEVYRHLVPDVDPPRVVRKGHYSPSCLVWLAGVRGAPPADAAHHNIHFGDAWRSSFDELLTEGVAMRDPSILVTVPTTGDPSLAPPGCSSLYVLEPVPNLDGGIDWARDGAALTDRLQARVASLGYPTDDVVVSEVVDPVEWERRGMTRGTPFALSHRFFQTGPFRPRNTDSRVPGLVFVGSGTVPGVGVPMVLLSGRLAADRVEQVGRR